MCCVCVWSACLWFRCCQWFLITTGIYLNTSVSSVRRCWGIPTKTNSMPIFLVCWRNCCCDFAQVASNVKHHCSSGGLLHSRLRHRQSAASAINQPSPAVRTTTPTFAVRLLGLLCCWFDCQELVARQSTRPGTFSALILTGSQNFLILILLAYTAH